ncbi:HK97 family phage prohead protease [Sphingomonas sp. CFBP 13728]|uniref:HK97 family phage prohead protease n=1 Tax=Sphingomonas sp. CFBP 13728 TaxID=2775294 RepID=UPI001786023D|nr:HK97 family phage prohead protease [Sphingomonas sp. CFBP 13728]MBD8620111.1 HK97 family phage prohead protease [Sphingomonas sp. CFBP 13728]
MTIFHAHLSIASIEETGVVSGIGATWAVNRNGFTTDPGAFAKSLAEHRARGSMPAMLLHHDHKRPIGRWTHMEPRAEGLYVAGKLARDTQDGGEAYNLLKAGALSGLSIGLNPGPNLKYVDERGEGGTRFRRYTQADLTEVSLVTVPADPDSLVLTVASLRSARDIEDIFRQANVSSRKAKAAATAAWRAIDATAEPDTSEIQQILSAASGSLSRFHRSK